MLPIRPDARETAVYVSTMLDELLKLSRPLHDRVLESLLKIAADAARRTTVEGAYAYPPDRALESLLKMAADSARRYNTLKGAYPSQRPTIP